MRCITMRKSLTNRFRAYPIALAIALLVILTGCTPAPAQDQSVKWNGNLKEFTVRAFQFGFDPDTLTVDLGDKVRLSAYSDDVPHGLALMDFGVNMRLMDKKPVTAEFIADKPGEFRFFCSIPCGRGHGSMAGKLVVRG